MFNPFSYFSSKPFKAEQKVVDPLADCMPEPIYDQLSCFVLPNCKMYSL